VEERGARAEREVAHGRKLASQDPERIWGWGTPAGRVRAERRARLIAAGARLGPDVTALEVGCGTGLFTAAFAATGARLVAVDLSEELLAHARARGLPSDRVRLLCRPFETCELEGPFDAVIGSSILHHLRMPDALVRIRALPKPGGVLSFAEPNMLNPQVAVQKNVPWVKRRLGESPDETAFFRWRIRALLRDAQFDEVSVKPFDWVHPATPSTLIPALELLGGCLESLPGVREFAGSLHIRAVRSRR
jgi:SAM-dependent methyltransferase